MVQGAMTSLACRGLQATSFSEVLAATGAPRGSLYHHFPGGKHQLVAEAVDRAGAVLTDAIAPVAGASAEDVVERFLATWRTVLMRSRCEAGCAVLAVTVASDSAELLSHATAVFRDWRELLADLLRQGGLGTSAAQQFATVMIASTEGAVVLSRANQSLEPFDSVSLHLTEQIRTQLAAAKRAERP